MEERIAGRDPRARNIALAVIALSLACNAMLALALHYGVTTRSALAIMARTGLAAGAATGRLDRVVAWGDSLTAGAGAEFGHDFPAILRTVYGRETVNFGIGGQTSTEIKARMLNRLRGLDDGSVTLIWAGRNDMADPDRVVANVRDMVATLPEGARFLLLEVPNGGGAAERRGEAAYEQVRRLNETLAGAFPANIVPVRARLVAYYRADSPGDLEDVAHDVVPRSLRSDDIHLNNRGQAVIAALVDEALTRRGW